MLPKIRVRHADCLSTVGANTRFAPTTVTAIDASMIYFLGRRTTDSGTSRGGVDIGIDRCAGTSCPVVGWRCQRIRAQAPPPAMSAPTSGPLAFLINALIDSHWLPKR